MKDEKTGDDLVIIGFVIDLEYADATTSAHDLLQQFKLHPLVKKILEGGERVGWGAKALPGGGYWSMPKLSMPGAVIVGDAGGMVDTVALKGVHHCDQVRQARRRGDLRRAARAADHVRVLRGRDRGVGDRQGALRGPQHAPAVPEGLHPGRPARQPDDRDEGQASPAAAGPWHRNDAQPMFIGKTHETVPEARRQVHVRQALVGLHHRQRDARRRAEPHPRAEERPARDRRDVALDVPGRASTRSPRTRPSTATST